jgi:hypothetical protein
MWDWNEGLKSSECFGVLFCRSTNLQFQSSISFGEGIGLSPTSNEPPSFAWLPALSANQVSHLVSSSLEVSATAGPIPEEDQADRIRALMGAAKLSLDALTLAGVRFEGDHFLAGGCLDDPASQHGKVTVLPAYTYSSRGEDYHDPETRLAKAARIYETLTSRLEGRAKTVIVQRALKSLMESLTVSDRFARLYLTTSALQGLLKLDTPDSRLHVGQRLDGLVRNDITVQPSVTEVLLRSLSIRDDYQRIKGDNRPIAQRQAAAMEEWIPRLLPFLEAFTIQLLQRTLLKPVLTEALGNAEAITEFWSLAPGRREMIWGEPLLISPTGETPLVVAVVQGGLHSRPRNASTIAQAA